MLFGDAALELVGGRREGFNQRELRTLRRLARASYAARVAGSLWAEVVRAR